MHLIFFDPKGSFGEGDGRSLPDFSRCFVCLEKVCDDWREIKDRGKIGVFG